MPDPHISIIVPAFNEEEAIDDVLSDLVQEFPRPRYQIIVVDDGSSDRTAEIAQRHPVQLIRHRRNRGYGAALKTGIRSAQCDIVAFIDADCQHRALFMHRILDELTDKDQHMAVGVRSGMVKGTLWRSPGKFLIRKLAEWLTREPVPDINSGMRALKREQALRFLPLCPDGFSITTTLTLCLMCEKLQIGYVPIEVDARKGRSTVRLRDGFRTLFNVAALVVLFYPIRVFFPLSAMTLLAGLLFGCFGIITYGRLPNSSAVTIVGSLLIFCFAFIAEQISLLRRVLVDFRSPPPLPEKPSLPEEDASTSPVDVPDAEICHGKL
jgi:glycosyltransferase involved in cell wall biosynthesis